MPRRIRSAALFIASITAAGSLALAPPSTALPDPPAYGVGITHNVPITMSDGVVLEANVYAPTDPSTGKPARGPFPVVLTLTPYGKDQGESDPERGDVGMGMDKDLIEHGYIHATVDVRGTGLSGGTWSFEQPQESADGARVVNWASKLPHSTGSVGMIGESYAGINQLLLAGRIGAKSPLKAIMPIVPSDDVYRDVAAPGGVTNPLLLAEFVLANLPLSEQNALTEALKTARTPADVTRLLSVMIGHLGGLGALPVAEVALGGPAVYDEPYWQDRSPHNVLGDIVANDVPTMILGGWRDAFQRGGPHLYAGLQNAAAGRSVSAPMDAGQKADPRFQLIYGDWYHNQLGLPSSPDRIQVNAVALRWFDHWLKGVDNGVTATRTPLRTVDRATGAWTQGATYPFAGAAPTRMYLGAGNTLSTTAPTDSGTDAITWSNTPLCTPSITQFLLLGSDQNALDKAGLPPSPCNTDDRATQKAPYAQTYTTAPLKHPRVIAGPISAHISAKVNTKDSEWVVRLEDVAPDGTSTPLSRGALLGSHRALDSRRTWSAPDGTPLVPYHPHTRASADQAPRGTVNSYDVEVFPTQATIAAGHRIRVTIGTNDSPALLPSAAQTVNLAGGVYRIRRGGGDASYVQVPLAAPGATGAPCTDAVMCP
ncbi:CocE/NonD family hydrolase [Streptomyces sp. NBC_01016]|uniref:CocE/NonD family hydrolase n=1 Tax=Streptomyces sp. NBC_01016 TaxID=2903720 RepID=UPI00225B5175|nr:CocE/NonD family hydrolase [Streptomyces sp. NBC_01016]MCX4834373.1 CocE/NonD family hydrolase [Streptomyces sp. NBC_01016]